MSTATLPGKTDTDLDSDIAAMVNAAFSEIDCSSTRKDKIPCSGEVAGFQEMHDCIQGALCQAHWELAVQVLYPAWRKQVEQHQRIHCAHCLNLFTNMHHFYRLIPIK